MKQTDTLEWKEIPGSKKILCDTRVLTLTSVDSVSPDGGKGSYIIMDAPEWAIVVPVLERDGKREFVMVKQWRHGTRSLSVEFPGGVLNAGENPQIGAIRELTEETGYIPGKVSLLGTVSPNPAIMSNRLHIFVAEQLSYSGNRALDEDEYVDALTISEQDVYKNMGKEPYIHAFMSTALFLYRRYRDE